MRNVNTCISVPVFPVHGKRPGNEKWAVHLGNNPDLIILPANRNISIFFLFYDSWIITSFFLGQGSKP